MPRDLRLEQFKTIGDDQGAMIRCAFSPHCTYTEWATDLAGLVTLAETHLSSDHGLPAADHA